MTLWNRSHWLQAVALISSPHIAFLLEYRLKLLWIPITPVDRYPGPNGFSVRMVNPAAEVATDRSAGAGWRGPG